MEILVIGDGSDNELLDQLCQGEENKVFYHNHKKTSPDLTEQTYKGQVQEVDNIWDLVDGVDFIIFTIPGFGKDIDLLASRGYPVLGAGVEIEKLNKDEPSIRRACINLDAGVYPERPPLEGMDCSIRAFFNGKVFVPPYCIHFAHHRLMNGEVGPRTPNMASTLIYTNQELPFIGVLNKMSSQLVEGGFKGLIGANCMVTQDGFSVKNFDTRIGGMTFLTQTILHEESLSPLLEGIAKGSLDKFSAQEDLWAVGVGLNQPGYPYEEIIKKAGSVKITGLQDALDDGCLIKLGGVVKKDNEFFTRPGVGRVMVLTGKGETIEKARFSAYRALDYLDFQDALYRLDVGYRVERSMHKLCNFGVLPKSVTGGLK